MADAVKGKEDMEGDEKLRVEKPMLGMVFNNKKELKTFYSNYAREEGFGVMTRSSNTGEDGELKYITLACARSGKNHRLAKNSLHPLPSTKTDCKAKVNAKMYADGKFRLTTVVLEHNHGLSPSKARYHKSNKKMNSQVKRRLELNDQAGISVNRNFYSFVVEAGGYDKLTFGEKDCRNYIDKARRIRLGVGDAEAIRNYFVKMQAKNSNFFYVMDLGEDGRLRNVFWADARSYANVIIWGCCYF